ncbi:MAG: nitroreductase family protein [Planctomycetes bacterium]|nr:nitroreductase family protein [Planctomycetota bacterium]
MILSSTTAETKLELEFADLEASPSVEGSLVHALRCAALAPSSHNSQPWLFQLSESRIDLFADRSRALPVVDPFDRELVISCGAALFQLRVALQRLGWRTQVDVLPDPHTPDHLARVVLDGREEPCAETRILYENLTLRHTNRNPFEARAVPSTLVAEFVRCARSEGSWLAALEGPAKFEAAQLISEADQRQFRDPHFRRELAAWMSSGHIQRRDGLPGSVLGLGPIEATLAPLLLRTFRWKDHERAARDRELALGSPLLLALGSWHEEPAEWLAAGQALAHVLLAATAAGLQASFLNQPVEVSNFRHRLRELAGYAGFVQLVLRVGYGPASAATPRRRLDEILLETLAEPTQRLP